MTRTLSPTAESRVEHWLCKEVDPTHAVLELGCGLCPYLKALPNKVRIGIEAFRPYIETTLKAQDAQDIILMHGDMRSFDKLVRRHWDTAMLIDSLEHLPFHDGVDLLRRLQLTADTILVFAPYGLHEQEECDGNVMQLHLSTWTDAEMEQLGFKVTVDPVFHHGNPIEKQAAMFCRWDRE